MLNQTQLIKPPALVSIQVLRAVAAVLILIAHSWPQYGPYGLTAPFHMFVSGSVGVELFFVISGFIMVYTSERFFGQLKGSVKFFLRRLIRIVPLYWIITTMVLIPILRGPYSLAHFDLSWGVVMAAYFFFPFPRPSGATHPVAGEGWTLNYEMFFYFLFAIACMLPRRAAVISTILALLFLLINSQFPIVSISYPLTHYANHLLWPFVYGLLIGLAYSYNVRIPLWLTVVVVSCGITSYMITSYLFDYNEMSKYRHLAWAIPSSLVVGGLVFCKVSYWNNKFWRGIAFIGDASYALYLTHPLVLERVRLHFIRKNFVEDHPWLFEVIQLSAAIIVAIIVYKYFEKPLTRWLNSILNKTKYFEAI